MLTQETLGRLSAAQKGLLIAAIQYPQFPLFLDGDEPRHRYPDDRSGPIEPYLSNDWAIRNAVEDHPNMRLFLDALCEVTKTRGVKSSGFDYADVFALFVAPPEKVVNAYLLSHVEAEASLDKVRALLPDREALAA